MGATYINKDGQEVTFSPDGLHGLIIVELDKIRKEFEARFAKIEANFTFEEPTTPPNLLKDKQIWFDCRTVTSEAPKILYWDKANNKWVVFTGGLI